MGATGGDNLYNSTYKAYHQIDSTQNYLYQTDLPALSNLTCCFWLYNLTTDWQKNTAIFTISVAGNLTLQTSLKLKTFILKFYASVVNQAIDSLHCSENDRYSYLLLLTADSNEYQVELPKSSVSFVWVKQNAYGSGDRHLWMNRHKHCFVWTAGHKLQVIYVL